MRSLYQWQQGHRAASGGLTEDCHIAAVTAKALDVLVNPHKRGQLIHKAEILGIRVICSARQVRKTKESKRIETVLY